MQGVPQKEDFSVIKTSIYFVIVLFSTIILTPLEVISTRLAIQRNHASPEYNSVTQEVDGDAEDDTAEYAGAEEDVIGSVFTARSIILYALFMILKQITERT